MAASTKSSGIQEGYGGDSQWEALKKYALADVDFMGKPGFETKSELDAAKPSAQVSRQLGNMETSIDKLAEANAAMLKGEIPADVSASVRRAASENSIAGGIFGSSARALSARDLGTTSLQIKAQGMETEAKINEMRGNVASAYETVRQFNLNRNSQLRELDLKAREQNLKSIDVERQRIQTNISANVEILGYMTDLVKAQQQLAVQASTNDVDPANVIASIDGWLAQMNKKLS